MGEQAEAKSVQKSLFKRIGAYISDKFNKLLERPTLFIFVVSFIVNLIIEMLSRHSVGEGFMFIFRNPVGFLLDMSIVAVTFLPSVFFKKRYPVIILVTAIWLGLGITNFIITLFRLAPFSISDFALFKATLPLMPIYLGIFGLILCILGIIGIIFLIVFMFIKMKAVTLKLAKQIKTVVSILLIFGITLFTALQSGAVTTIMTNSIEAYGKYGFTYCFSAGTFLHGMPKPADYTAENVDKKIKDLDEETDSQPTANDVNPNIIIIQLESFFDVKNLSGIEFSEDPVPNFTKLKETCPHGLLGVPAFGAGTAITEFEVLTGMNTSLFYPGEMPYTGVLQTKTCESVCYNLKNYGYTSHAIHNHYATFYGRNKAYRNLGFDTFTPVEYMSYVPTTYMGWEKDEILPYYIDKALTSTDNRDVVFTVTVQCHGAYPTQADDAYTPTITSRSEERFTKEELISFDYYTSMLHDTDKMIGALTEKYASYDEPVMIVLYGDHLPGIDVTDDDLTHGTVMETEYVIWTNYEEPEPTEKNLEAYQLSAYIMRLCGKNDGIITKVHQAYDESDDYNDVLHMLQFGMLFDKSEEIEDIRPIYAPSDMKFGIDDITVTSAGREYDEESMSTINAVHGTGFTPWSVISVNGTKVRTVFKGASTLIADGIELKAGDVILVSQIQDTVVLSSTDEYVIPGE